MTGGLNQEASNTSIPKAGAARRRFLFCALEHHHHTLPSILDVNVDAVAVRASLLPECRRG
jgi:hypothetical protein